eukprot:jgi/Tetstr1/448120/TSEL_035415.t2
MFQTGDSSRHVPGTPDPCAVCGEAAAFRCSSCKAVRYCSRKCQGQHWKAHKLECRRLEDDVQRTGTAPVGTSSTGRQQTGERAQEEEGPAVLDVPNARRRVLGIRALAEAHRRDADAEQQRGASGGGLGTAPAARGAPCGAPLPPSAPRAAGTGSVFRLNFDRTPRGPVMPAQEGVAAAAAATTAEAEAAPAPPRDKGWYSEWGWLPPEMLQLAMARMGGPELAAISGVCTAWRAASAQTSLWRALLVSEGLQPAGGGGAEAGNVRSAVGLRGLRNMRSRSMQGAAATLKAQYGVWYGLQSAWKEGRYASHTVRVHSHNVECLRLVDDSPWGALLLSASWDGSLAVFKRPECTRMHHYSGHTGWITGMDVQHGWKADGSGLLVITGGTDSRLAAWDLEAPGDEPLVEMFHALGGVTCCAFVAGAQAQGSLHRAMDRISSSLDPLPSTSSCEGETGRTRGSAGIAASGSDDGLGRVWDCANGSCLAVLSGHGGVLWGLRPLGGPRCTLVTSSRDGTARLWVLAGEDGGRLPLPAAEGGFVGLMPVAMCEGHSSAVLALDAPPPPCNGQLAPLFVTGSADGTCRVWSSTSGSCTAVLTGHSHGILAVKLASFRGLGASSQQAGGAQMGAAGKGEEGGDAVAPWHLVSGSHDHSIRVWDVRSGECLAVLSNHRNPVVALATFGNVLVSLAPGEGVLAYVYDSKSHRQQALRPGGAAGVATAREDGATNGSGRARRGALGRLRSAVAESRGGGGSDGFTVALSLLEGGALSFQAAVALDVSALALGSRTGEVLLLDYGDAKRRRRHGRGAMGAPTGRPPSGRRRNG